MDANVLAELRHLQEHGRPRLIHEMLTTFRGDAPQRLAEMRAAVSASDSDRLKKAAHQLKGVAGSLGARRLAALCAQLEQNGHGGIPQNAAALLADAEIQFEKACAVLEAQTR